CRRSGGGAYSPTRRRRRRPLARPRLCDARPNRGRAGPLSDDRPTAQGAAHETALRHSSRALPNPTTGGRSQRGARSSDQGFRQGSSQRRDRGRARPIGQGSRRRRTGGQGVPLGHFHESGGRRNERGGLRGSKRAFVFLPRSNGKGERRCAKGATFGTKSGDRRPDARASPGLARRAEKRVSAGGPKAAPS